MKLPNLILYPWKLSIFQCTQLPDMAQLRASAFLSVTTTPQEISVVCETAHVPQETRTISDGWRCIGVEGPLDFSMVGVLSPIASALAKAQVSIFAISSFDTDYILVKQDALADACCALEAQSYHIKEREKC